MNKVQMFKRFLKEIGLYSNWIKNRKIYLDAIKGVKFENRYIMENSSSVWAPARIQPNLGCIIDWSFDYWNHPDEALWHELYMRLKDNKSYNLVYRTNKYYLFKKDHDNS